MHVTPKLLYLDPRDLHPAPHNCRTQPGDLAGLTETIREHGLLQPIGVTRRDGSYQVVYGNRRREAAIAAGLEAIPCLVLERQGDDEVLALQLMENLQRLDLGDLEKARAFRQALDALQKEGKGAKAEDQLAQQLGLSVRQIQRYLSLLDLEPEVQILVEAGELGVTQAQHLRPVAPAERQVETAALAVQESLSAVELARLCRALVTNSAIAPAAALARLRQGEEVPDFRASQRETSPVHLPPPPPKLAPDGEEEDEGEYEEADDQEEGWTAPEGRPAAETATRDGNRVRKFHSLDSFVDEIDRLALCAQEGELERLLASDPTGAVKLSLAARQVRHLAEKLASLVSVPTR